MKLVEEEINPSGELKVQSSKFEITSGGLNLLLITDY
jgi:hypothetical protein